MHAVTMHAVTMQAAIGPTRRFANLLVALLICGCSTAVSSSPATPTSSDSSSATSEPTATPRPTLRSYPPLPSHCPIDPPNLNLEASYQGIPDVSSGFAGLGITSVRPLDSESEQTFAGLEGWDGGRLLGGQILEVSIVDDSSRPKLPFAVTSSTASLRLGDGARLVLPVTPDETGSLLRMPIPDRGGFGELSLSISWSDACFEYEAAAGLDVEVVPQAVVAACPAEANQATVVGHYDDEMAIADVRVSLGIDSWRATYTGEWTVSDGNWLFGWSESTPLVTAERETSLLYVLPDPDLKMTEIRADFYARAQVAAQTASEPAFWARKESARPVDRFTLVVPSIPGRYVALVNLTWELPCVTGTANSLVSVDVN